MKTESISIIIVIFGTIISSFAPLMLKLGMVNKKFTLFNLIINVKVISGVLLYILSSFFFVFALRRGELSVLYPLVSLNYIWVTIISRIFLNEEIKIPKIIGIVFLIIGITLIAFSN